MKFVIFSEFGELLDLAMKLQDEDNEVVFHVPVKDYETIGEGIVKKDKEWWRYIGQGYIWCFDGNAYGDLQDWLREKGEKVFGGTKQTDELENDRQLGQKLFKAAGFIQPQSENFIDIDKAIGFILNNADKKFILKQNGDAPKSINHLGKFNGSEDMLFHLEGLKKKWNEAEFGKVNFDLMEVVEGLEIAASAWFNGKDWMRNKRGKVVGFLNFEEKKEANGQTGETCGEMGTTFIGVDEDNETFKDILLRPKITEALKATQYKGIFDINCIKTQEGIVALEPTCRFGVPATSYEFMEGLETPVADLIESVSMGEGKPIEIKEGIGMVMVSAAKPFPIDANEKEQTSLGERLWIMKNGKPVKDFDKEQKKHIHLQNFEKKDGNYFVATKNGYLLTITGIGKTIADTRENLIQYIKDNLYISGMKYRTDIGARVEEAIGVRKSDKIKEEYETKLAEEKSKSNQEINKLKQAMREAIYVD